MDTTNHQESNHSQNSRNGKLPNGWTPPQGGHIPEPTYMPVVMALGVMCLLWGIITTYLISLVGLVLFVVALWGWIGGLRREYRHS